MSSLHGSSGISGRWGLRMISSETQIPQSTEICSESSLATSLPTNSIVPPETTTEERNLSRNMSINALASEGWATVSLGDVITSRQGGTPSKSRKEYWCGYIPFVTAADLTEFRVGATNARSFLTIQGLNSGATAICEPGSLLLATRTRVGLVGVVNELMGASQDITVLTANGLVDPTYLYWALRDSAAQLQKNTRGTSIQGVTRNDVDFLPILMPPLPEQRAIAAALSDMDGLLDSLDALIIKKQALKQGAMQQLLTGRTRLPGFGGEWQTKRLGDFVPFTYGESLPVHARNSSGNVQVYGSNGVVDHHDVAVTAGPTIVIGRKGSVGKVHFSPEPCWPIDTTFFVTSDDADLLKFKYYALGTLGLDKMNTDSAVPGINRNMAHARELRVPPLPEQRAIAIALSDMDAEIAALVRRRDKTEAIKQGIMQELLTGRIRLVEAK